MEHFVNICKHCTKIIKDHDTRFFPQKNSDSESVCATVCWTNCPWAPESVNLCAPPAFEFLWTLALLRALNVLLILVMSYCSYWSYCRLHSTAWLYPCNVESELIPSYRKTDDHRRKTMSGWADELITSFCLDTFNSIQLYLESTIYHTCFELKTPS